MRIKMKSVIRRVLMEDAGSTELDGGDTKRTRRMRTWRVRRMRRARKRRAS